MRAMVAARPADGLMKKEDAEEFTSGLGQIVGGSYKIIWAAQRMGVPKALGLSTDQWVNERLGGYVRLAVEDRRKAVQELKSEGESNRSISRVLGVDRNTVAADLETAEIQPPHGGETAEIQPPNLIALKRKAGEDARAAVLESPVDPEILAAMFGCGKNTVQRAIKVRKAGAP